MTVDFGKLTLVDLLLLLWYRFVSIEFQRKRKRHHDDSDDSKAMKKKKSSEETTKSSLEATHTNDAPEDPNSNTTQTKNEKEATPLGLPLEKTPAQLAFERNAKKQEKLVLLAGGSGALTYRQRIDEYNKRLAALSEHHDIPKVGPG